MPPNDNPELREKALERFKLLYQERRDLDRRLGDAADWIIGNVSPFRKGEIVKCPRNGSDPGKQMTITSVKLDCEPDSGRIFWAISGEGGFFRVDIRGELPATESGMQPELL
jgi:hypothetical protein